MSACFGVEMGNPVTARSGARSSRSTSMWDAGVTEVRSLPHILIFGAHIVGDDAKRVLL